VRSKPNNLRAASGQAHLRPIGLGLCEVRISLQSNRITRVLFTMHESQMVLLHGFVKKTQKAPQGAIDLARERMWGVKK
jgi:phage-related protein